MFQLCACHSDTPQYNSSETFRNVPLLLSHVCLCAVRFDGYAAAARAAPELVELVLGKMKRVGENFSYPFYAIKAAMLSLLVFL